MGVGRDDAFDGQGHRASGCSRAPTAGRSPRRPERRDRSPQSLSASPRRSKVDIRATQQASTRALSTSADCVARTHRRRAIAANPPSPPSPGDLEVKIACPAQPRGRGPGRQGCRPAASPPSTVRPVTGHSARSSNDQEAAQIDHGVDMFDHHRAFVDTSPACRARPDRLIRHKIAGNHAVSLPCRRAPTKRYCRDKACPV